MHIYQAEATRLVTAAVVAERFNPATLFLIGTPAVGAERLLLAVARSQRAPLYVSAAKRQVLTHTHTHTHS
jgi:hypothetical protein